MEFRYQTEITNRKSKYTTDIEIYEITIKQLQQQHIKNMNKYKALSPEHYENIKL